MIFDSCYSGLATRGYEAEIARRSVEIISAVGSSPYVRRDVRAPRNWLLNSDGYAILCACGPEEYAEEYTEECQNRGLLYVY